MEPPHAKRFTLLHATRMIREYGASPFSLRATLAELGANLQKAPEAVIAYSVFIPLYANLLSDFIADKEVRESE